MREKREFVRGRQGYFYSNIVSMDCCGRLLTTSLAQFIVYSCVCECMCKREIGRQEKRETETETEKQRCVCV